MIVPENRGVDVGATGGVSYDGGKAERIASIPAKRLDDLDGFGAASAFLCSVQAGLPGRI
jgi:hypothetical protein